MLLFYASGSFAFQSDFLSFFSWPRQPVQRVLTVTVDTLVPVFSYTVSEISKKFLFIFFPGNNMLVFLGVCVCVCVWCSNGVWQMQMQSSWNWYQIHWAFVGIQGNQREWFPHQFRGQQVEDLILSFLALLLCGCWLTGYKSYKTWFLTVQFVLFDSMNYKCGYGLENCKTDFWQQLFFWSEEVHCKKPAFQKWFNLKFWWELHFLYFFWKSKYFNLMQQNKVTVVEVVCRSGYINQNLWYSL